MYAGITDQFLPAIRHSHTAYGYVEAWRGGEIIAFDGGSLLPLADDGTRLPMRDGEIQVDGSTGGVRRTLSATFAPVAGLFEALAPIGTELHPYTVLRHPNGVTETVPQGVFDIDVESMGYVANGDIRITAPDRWTRVQRARFLTPRAANAGATIRAQIIALLLEAMPAGVDVVDLGTSEAIVPAQVWDRDRDKAIEELAKAASLDVFMDRTGAPTIRDIPAIDAENVAWTVDAGDAGVMIDADRERNRQRTYNVVVVNGTANEGVVPFKTQYVWDNNPASPTYAGAGSGAGDEPPDPATAGPFGQRPTFYTSPLLRDVSQALVAGHTILDRVIALGSQLTLTTVANSALDDGDTILVKLPPKAPGDGERLELHLVDKFPVPLFPSRSSQKLSTRSVVTDVEES